MLKNGIQILASLAMIAVSAGCSLSGRDSDSSIYVDLSSLKTGASRFALLDTATGLVGGTSLAPPSSSANFSCYAVNVTGPGIADTSNNNDKSQDPMIDFYKTLNVPGNYCAYRGVVTPPLFLNANGNSVASLLVPPGGVRLVQIVGVNDPVVCASGVVDDPVGSTDNGGGRFFEIGRTVVNDLFGDRSIDVKSDWPTTAALQALRKMDCGDGADGCSTYEYYPSSNPSYSTISTISKYAQKINARAGEYLKAVELPIIMFEAANVTVTIYQATSGSTVPSAPTSYTKTLALPAGSLTSYVFELGRVGDFLMTNANTDYWIVLSADVTSGVVGWQNKGGTATGTAQFSGSTWTAASGVAAYNYRMRSCTN